jgi:hypothetical protein
MGEGQESLPDLADETPMPERENRDEKKKANKNKKIVDIYT